MDVRDYVIQAQEAINNNSLWDAYVAVERAILHLKLRADLEHEQSPSAIKRTVKKDELVKRARSALVILDLEGDKKKLLYDLRICRDALKAAVARG